MKICQDRSRYVNLSEDRSILSLPAIHPVNCLKISLFVLPLFPQRRGTGVRPNVKNFTYSLTACSSSTKYTFSAKCTFGAMCFKHKVLL